MQYKFKRQQIASVDAQIVGEELERLEKANNGALLPATVVLSAKSKRSKLHNCFEWDDKKAGNEYRLVQARELLRKVVVVYKNDKGKDESIRAFVRIRNEDTETSYYCHTYRLLKDDELQDNVLEQILADLIAVKKKYGQFKSPALQKIWDAIDELAVA